MNRAFSLTWLLLVSGASVAQPDSGVSFAPESYEHRPSAAQVKLGEPFTYEIVLRHAPEARYELPTSGLNLGPFELLEHKRRREDVSGKSVTTVTLTLGLFELGEQNLPPLAFDVVRGSETGSWTLPGSRVEGVSTLAPKADSDSEGEALKDLKPLEQVPVRTYRLVYALLALLAAGLLAYAAYKIWKRRPPAAPVPVAAPLPLHTRARQALDALAAEDLPGQGRIKEFYSRLTDVVRGYLGERYGFEALECTSPELLEALRKKHTPGLELEVLAGLVAEADLVKFAKAQVGPAECKRALEVGYRVLDSTPFPSPPAST